MHHQSSKKYMNKLRIGIQGIGGVGGYFGGLLADKYHESENIEIVFITKPETKTLLQDNGLQLILPEGSKTIFTHVLDAYEKTEPFDLLINTVKSYSLEESLLSIKHLIGRNTILMPLQNGIDAAQRMQKLFPNNIVLEACVYIVAQLTAPGVVQVNGNMRKLHFGSDAVSAMMLKYLEQLFTEAGIECYLSPDIKQVIWKKFIFVSSIASVTSYLDVVIGKVLEDKNYRELLIKAMEEMQSIALAQNITLPESIIETTLSELEKLHYEATASMHRDFMAGRKTEFESLTKYVSDAGKELGIETKVYDQMVEALSKSI